MPDDTSSRDNLLFIHQQLAEASDILLTCTNKMQAASADTVFSLGEALGILAKAKALVGRDIDDTKTL